MSKNVKMYLWFGNLCWVLGTEKRQACKNQFNMSGQPKQRESKSRAIKISILKQGYLRFVQVAFTTLCIGQETLLGKERRKQYADSGKITND